jgi:hypothetical protein
MKLKIITHNIHNVNDLENITKERYYIFSLNPRIDIILLQDHKLRGRLLENLGIGLEPRSASWIS